MPFRNGAKRSQSIRSGINKKFFVSLASGLFFAHRDATKAEGSCVVSSATSLRTHTQTHTHKHTRALLLPYNFISLQISGRANGSSFFYYNYFLYVFFFFYRHARDQTNGVRTGGEGGVGWSGVSRRRCTKTSIHQPNRSGARARVYFSAGPPWILHDLDDEPHVFLHGPISAQSKYLWTTTTHFTVAFFCRRTCRNFIKMI